MTPKVNLLKAIRRDNPAWVPNGMENVITIKMPIVERPSEAGIDCFGVHWSFEQKMEGGTFPTIGKHPVKDLEKWREQIIIPNINDLDWSKVEEQAATIDRDQYLIQGFNNMGLFERSYLLMGMEDALIAYITEPELMKELLSAITEYKVNLISRFCDIVKPDILRYGDDWGTQQNLFLPREVWRDILKPFTSKIFSCVKDRGIMINLHSCGKVDKLLGDMVEMGVDIWNPCQPCNDLAELKKVYCNNICFCGGIDSQFVLDRPGVTTDEVRVEVRLRINEMAEGGGYIAEPSHKIPYDKDILFAMKDEISHYGREFYKRV